MNWCRHRKKETSLSVRSSQGQISGLLRIDCVDLAGHADSRRTIYSAHGLSTKELFLLNETCSALSSIRMASEWSNNCEQSSALALMPLICELLLRFDEFELLELSEFELELLLLLLLELELLSLSLSSVLTTIGRFVAFDVTNLWLYGCDDLWCDPLWWLWCRLSLFRISAISRRSSVN